MIDLEFTAGTAIARTRDLMVADARLAAIVFALLTAIGTIAELVDVRQGLLQAIVFILSESILTRRALE